MSTSQQNYASRLRQITHALAVGKNDSIADVISRRHSIDQVRMFTSGNLEKRFDKLKDQIELLEDQIPELETLIEDYVLSQPLQAYATGASDTENFISWLVDREKLTSEQSDLTVVIRSRTAILEIGRRNRMAHIRFQELRSLVDDLALELGTNPNLRIILNPVHLWGVFESSLFLDDDDAEAGPEREVLFYAYENEVRTAVLEVAGRVVMRTLGECQPCSLDELHERVDLAMGLSLDELQEVLLDSAEAGLIAFS
jgi:hypothetical protein